MTGILAVCGMTREADLLKRHDVTCVIGGGVRSILLERLDAAAREDVAGIISVGICGALDSRLDVGAQIVASDVMTDGSRVPADAQWVGRLSEVLPKAVIGVIAGTDTMLVAPAQKRALFDATRAIAADMESHVVANFAAARRIPFAAIRVVSDSTARPLPPAVLGAMKADGGVNVPAVLGSLLGNPFQLPALIRTARDSEIAFGSLFRCLDRLGPRLMGPDLG